MSNFAVKSTKYGKNLWSVYDSCALASSKRLINQDTEFDVYV